MSLYPTPVLFYFLIRFRFHSSSLASLPWKQPQPPCSCFLLLYLVGKTPTCLNPTLLLFWTLRQKLNEAGKTTQPVLIGLTLNSYPLTSSQLFLLPSNPPTLPCSSLSFSRHLDHYFISLSPQISNNSFPLLLNILLLISLRKEKHSDQNFRKLPLPNPPTPTCPSLLSALRYLSLLLRPALLLSTGSHSLLSQR